MSKAILLLLLTMASQSAMAAWTEIDDNSDFTVYADFVSIRKFNNKARMWSMYDYKRTPATAVVEFMSMKFQYEFDCQNNQARMLAFSLHSGNMGEGAVLYSDSKVGKWEAAIPGSLNETRWKVICGNSNQ